MKWFRFLLSIGATLAFSGAVRANLLTDGSFENAAQGSYFSGTITNSAWVVTTTGSNLNGVIIQPTGGSSYPADPLTMGDPQAGGTQTAYFVGDSEMDTLSQTLTGLSIGTSYQGVWSPWHRVISSETGLLPARSPLTWPFQNKDPFRK